MKTKLTEKQFDDIKMLLKLSSPGEIKRANPHFEMQNIRLVAVADTYAEYVESYKFQTDYGEVYHITNYTNQDIMRAVTDSTKQILKALAELQK